MPEWKESNNFVINRFLTDERDKLYYKIGRLVNDRSTALEKFMTYRLKGEEEKVEVLEARARNLVIEINKIDKDINDTHKIIEIMSLLII
jgi:hypothetical protein